MKKNNQVSDILGAISVLEESDAIRSNAEAFALFSRLTTLRGQFEDVFRESIDALMKISSLDLMLHDGTEKLQEYQEAL